MPLADNQAKYHAKVKRPDGKYGAACGADVKPRRLTSGTSRVTCSKCKQCLAKTASELEGYQPMGNLLAELGKCGTLIQQQAARICRKLLEAVRGRPDPVILEEIQKLRAILDTAETCYSQELQQYERARELPLPESRKLADAKASLQLLTAANELIKTGAAEDEIRKVLQDTFGKHASKFDMVPIGDGQWAVRAWYDDDPFDFTFTDASSSQELGKSHLEDATWATWPPNPTFLPTDGVST